MSIFVHVQKCALCQVLITTTDTSRTMSIEKPKSSMMPWMAAAEEDKWITFEVKHESVDEHKDAGPKEKWTCYRGDMKKISDGTKAGIHEVPFWAMEAFHEVTDGCDENGWHKYKYKRTETSGGKSECEFQEV